MINEIHKLRLKKLAGIVSENSIPKEPSLHADVGMILKLNPEDLSKVLSVDVPTLDLTTGYDMSKLPSEKVHVTLTSIKNFKPFRESFKNYTLPTDIKIPNVEIGESLFVHRPELNKVTYVMSIKNQEDFKSFVDKIYNSLGLENPESNRFYHITLANNEGGNPFKSIGNVTKKDFEK
tara:strand:- start:3496 stop:4029 length:534 start_codon:yes stop_codon:yes gene_type:complete